MSRGLWTAEASIDGGTGAGVGVGGCRAESAQPPPRAIAGARERATDRRLACARARGYHVDPKYF